MKIVLIILLASLMSSSIFGSQKNYIQWWVENHGDYTKTEGKKDLRAMWAFEVFERVKRTADKTQGREPRLLIIRTRRGIYAQALPDGGIIINPGTLDICYGVEKTSKVEGDPHMAFILGHELAHLGGDDFIHGEVADILDRWHGSRAKREIVRYFALTVHEKSRVNKQRELLADKKGVVYAAMAGYDVGSLFLGTGNFLRKWASQTGIGILYDRTPTHPSLANRLEFLRPQLREVAEHAELFDAGVLLFQLESYHDAAAAFKEFSKLYPSREVFNNIGACYFYLAMRRILKDYKDDYYRFRISTTIDYSTTAMRFQSRGEKNYMDDKDIARYIDNALSNFQRAVERDPSHADTLCNLAASSILKHEYAGAMATCDKILEARGPHVCALNNKAVALYYYGRKEGIDMTMKVVNLLQQAHEMKPGNLEVMYNLAYIKERRNRMAGAKQLWQDYLAASLRFPHACYDNFYIHVYKKLNHREPKVPRFDARIPAMPEGVSLGRPLAELEQKWGNAPKGFKLGCETEINPVSLLLDLQVMTRDNVRVIALDKTIELVEQEFQKALYTSDLLQTLGAPLRLVRHTGGHFYIYKGFSFKEINGTVISFIWFSSGF